MPSYFVPMALFHFLQFHLFLYFCRISTKTFYACRKYKCKTKIEAKDLLGALCLSAHTIQLSTYALATDLTHFQLGQKNLPA
jgi:hypothetical protein